MDDPKLRILECLDVDKGVGFIKLWEMSGVASVDDFAVILDELGVDQYISGIPGPNATFFLRTVSSRDRYLQDRAKEESAEKMRVRNSTINFIGCAAAVVAAIIAIVSLFR